ncbi:GLUG motif-containing protein, partial [Aliarcobacter cryaerophilus]|uniref:GLUG motif-containing protein n=1 Tax=Aliarcobacter cryaerophilus TaxID=28198 RepID=UPI003DA28C16
NINQSTQKASINWQDFSISQNETVNFNQPNKNSITLNRVIGNEKSVIDGALNANGQVWILNSNGTLFGKNAKVNTAGLLVTTKELSDEDFNKGNYNFKGNSTASIENLGNIDSKKYASFVANAVINNGTIKVHSGTVNLIGASEFSVTLDDNSNISLKVNKGVLDALVENNHLIIANGGNVYLTTNAKDELLKGVVNNSGIIEAASIDDLQSEVILFAHGGTANIDGEIKAKNSFVETSGENLSVKDSFKIQAKTWLLDPTNITIASNGTTPVNDVNGSSGDVTVSATAVQNALGGTNIELQADNNITVNENITWSEATQLKLTADSINVNATINNTNSVKGGVSFQAGNTTDKVVFGIDGKVIVNNVYQLQWIDTALNGKYELGRNIDASAIKTDKQRWSDLGFAPIVNFYGRLDGKGFTISDLFIERPNTDNTGLFGAVNVLATIKNIGLLNVDITGKDNVGGLVGSNSGGTIQNSYVSGKVTGNNSVGGLVGNNNRTITNSYATGLITGNNNVGGLVGKNTSTITNSYATGLITGNNNVGGLVGWNNGTIENSYASGTVSKKYSSPFVFFGGLIGDNFAGQISNSYYDNQANTSNDMKDKNSYGKSKAEILAAFKNKTGWSSGGGASVEGFEVVLLPYLDGITRSEDISQSILFSGGYGTSTNPYTITNWTQLQNINNSNVLTQNYFFSLLNNLDKNSSGYMGSTGEGWKSLGDSYQNAFKGTFDGAKFTISDLFINLTGKNNIGLFGVTKESTIKNVILKDVNITAGSFVGGLIGTSNNSIVENSSVTGKVSGSTNGYDIGGLIGFASPNSHIEKSYTNVTVNGGNKVGGLIGNLGYSPGTVLDSYALGDVTGDDYVGGLIGYLVKSKVTNTYSSGKVTSTGTNVGGLIGYNHDSSEVTSSFYDKTINKTLTDNSFNVGKTTDELSYGGMFKTADWDIVADSSVTSLTPVIKYDSVNNKYVWAISPLALTYTLSSDKSTTYNGQNQNLNSFYSSIFGANYDFISTTDYKFQVNSSDVTGYKDAGIYSNIKVASNNEFLAIANSGNTDGKFTINKANAIVTANSDSKVYNGASQSISGFEVSGLVNNETQDVLTQLTGLTTSGKNAGIYNTNIGGIDKNYNLTFNQGKLTITPKDITVVADNKSKIEGEVNP